jgi:hypothetical protein
MLKAIGGFEYEYHKKALDNSSQAADKSVVESYGDRSAWLEMLPDKQLSVCADRALIIVILLVQKSIQQ